LSVLLLVVGMLMFIMSPYRPSFESDTSIPESELDIGVDGQKFTVFDGFVSEENALSGDGGPVDQVGWKHEWGE
jgi:hypothetical protein